MERLTPGRARLETAIFRSSVEGTDGAVRAYNGVRVVPLAVLLFPWR